MTPFLAAPLIAAALAATLTPAHADEQVTKGQCSITYRGHAHLRSEDCLVEVSMSQGYSATIATMPDGPHAFRIDQDPDVDTTHVCVLNGVKGKLTKDYCCATRLATAGTGKTSVTYTFERPSASK